MSRNGTAVLLKPSEWEKYTKRRLFQRFLTVEKRGLPQTWNQKVLKSNDRVWKRKKSVRGIIENSLPPLVFGQNTQMSSLHTGIFILESTSFCRVQFLHFLEFYSLFFVWKTLHSKNMIKSLYN